MLQPRVILLLLVAAEDANVGDGGIQKQVQNGVAEGDGAASDTGVSVCKHVWLSLGSFQQECQLMFIYEATGRGLAVLRTISTALA